MTVMETVSMTVMETVSMTVMDTVSMTILDTVSMTEMDYGLLVMDKHCVCVDVSYHHHEA